MSGLLRMALEGGGSLLIRVDDESGDGSSVSTSPVRAGRLADRATETVAETSRSLQEALEPVTQMSRQVLDQLGRARPRKVQVEFGVELTAEVGAVLAKTGLGSHLMVTLTWGPDDESRSSCV